MKKVNQRLSEMKQFREHLLWLAYWPFFIWVLNRGWGRNVLGEEVFWENLIVKGKGLYNNKC